MPTRGADELLLLEGVRQGKAAVFVGLRHNVLGGEAPGAPAHLAHESGKPAGRSVGWLEGGGGERGRPRGGGGLTLVSCVD